MLKKYYMQVPGTKEELQPLWHSLLRMPFHKKDYEKEFEDLWYKGMRVDWFPCMLMGRYGQLKYENNMVEAEKVKALFKRFSSDLKYRSIYIDNAEYVNGKIRIFLRCKEEHNKYDILDIFACYNVRTYYIEELKSKE